MEFFRFPHTPHLAWLGPGQTRDDKVLSPDEARALLAHELVVEEKVDGANLGFSVDEAGTLRAQNRGAFLVPGAAPPQFKHLARWMGARGAGLADALFPDLMLFGEWCYAVHSVRYTRLPDWLLVFDIYDRARAEFWSAARRDALAAELGLAVVPRLGAGRYGLEELCGLLGHSRLGDGPAEGLYVRREGPDTLLERAKLVRPEFVQAIDQHWSRRPLQVNTLAGTNGLGDGP